MDRIDAASRNAGLSAGVDAGISAVRSAATAAGGAARPAAISFGDAMARVLENVSEQQAGADALQRSFQLNDPATSLEETMIAMQGASLSFQALVQVRNRLVSAYQEIMNMQV